MLFENGRIFTEQGAFVPGWFTVEDGRFTAVEPDTVPKPACRERTDLQGARVIPGLVDTHIHGLLGADLSDGSAEGLLTMGRGLLRYGVTSFAPASMTLPYNVLEKAFRSALDYRRAGRPDAARLMGIHMEGPFFSMAKKGAQNPDYLRDPDFDAFKRLYDGCEGLIRIVDLAAELPGAAEFAAKAAPLTTVSLAHSNASYEEARAVFDAGATHVSHLYNAMTPFHHLRPGILGAASEDERVFAELICDGHHVSPSAVRMAFKLFPGRIILVTDALRCMGMPEGEYTLGGQRIILKDGLARLTDGTVAGAATGLFTALANAIRFGIPESEAIPAATLRPARAIGADHEVGSLKAGKLADFLLVSDAWQLKEVFLGGRRCLI